jgi:hypothetical protein
VTAAAGRNRVPYVAASAWVLFLGGLILLLVAALPPLSILADQSLRDGGGGQAALGVVFAMVGFLVAWQKPTNPLGWLMIGVVLFFALQSDASLYAIADYRIRHGNLPLGPLAMILQVSWAPTIVLFGLLVLLFPDGRLPSPRWRWVLWMYLALAALWIAGSLTITIGAIIEQRVHVDAGGNLTVLSHPTGSAAWWGSVQDAFFVVLVICWLVSVAAQVVNFRHAVGVRRQQLKVLVGGSLVAVVGGALSVVLSGRESPILQTISSVAFVAVVALPVSVGVAILRYRLYDIDRIISRTLTYAIVTGMLIGVYVALLALFSVLLPDTSSSLAVAASTLAAAAVARPGLKRVQAAVDRRFNRARYDALQTVDDFGTRLRNQVDPHRVREDLVAVVNSTLQPGSATIWIRRT